MILPAERRAISHARTFNELAEIAIRSILRLPQPVVQVSGPMTTGGCGSVEQNLRAFATTIDELCKGSFNVFDQMPFVKPYGKIWRQGRFTYLYGLQEFYGRIFDSGYIATLCCMPLWNTSRGAMWECAYAKKRGISIIHLLSRPSEPAHS